ncbi:MAG: hypothetical protein HZA78_04185 [Candidatus Schekmanbacteria bacterium]|nr:hypothetical protein [Candidatus Schekmanbacteria bacterium]
MENTLKIINEMEEHGVIGRYAVCGGIAAIFYIEPILTYDLDIFFVPAKETRGLITLSPIYDYLAEKGYPPEREQVIIEGVPVQFIPVYNELVREAVENAVATKYKQTGMRVIKAEYLVAIMLQTFRPKDKERIIKFMDEAELDGEYLQKILQKYGLNEKYEQLMRLYYEK